MSSQIPCHGCDFHLERDEIIWATEDGRLTTTGYGALPWCDTCLPEPGHKGKVVVDMAVYKKLEAERDALKEELNRVQSDYLGLMDKIQEIVSKHGGEV